MRNPAQPPRVAAVSYLNTVPLVWGVLHGPQRSAMDLDFCVPSECADRVRDGRAAIGIVPVIEIARQELEIIPGNGIACRGPVRSILLISRKPFGQIKSVACDLGSRTSVVLTEIILREKYGVTPEFRAMPPDLAPMLGAADAALIIGDPALRINPAALPYAYVDLGAEWTSWTGLPMVFAAWAGRPENIPPDAAAEFAGSYAFGEANLGEIIRAESAARGFAPALVREYLTRHIAFSLGERDYDGMKAYLRMAGALTPARV